MQPAPRLLRIDALRGLAMVWMTVFHFCFDLVHFGYWKQDFYNDPFWTWQRSCIVGLFLFCAGMSQAVALEHGQTAARFWRRWVQIAGCALLVTASSVWMFPQSYIYFGVLHGIAVMLLLVRATAGWGPWLWLAGLVAVLLPNAMKWIAGEHGWMLTTGLFLNEKPWNILGLISRKPITEDYVPLLPWLGLMWSGMAAGQWLQRSHVSWLAGPVPVAAQPLTMLGRWSLSYYMLHQPVLIGTLMAIATLR